MSKEALFPDDPLFSIRARAEENGIPYSHPPWFAQVLAYSREWHAQHYGDYSFESRAAWLGDGPNQGHKIIFVPVYGEGELYRWQWVVEEYASSAAVAHALRFSIIDEDLPLEYPVLFDRHWLIGGRRGDATMLGILRYTPALPQLVEALSHDRDSDLRHRAAESIGEIGTAAGRYVSTLCRSLYTDQDTRVRAAVAESLGSIGSRSAAPALREVAEETQYRFSVHEDHFDDEGHRLFDLYEHSLIALASLHPQWGREALQRAAKDDSSFVWHVAKRALVFIHASEEKEFENGHPGIYPLGDVM